MHCISGGKITHIFNILWTYLISQLFPFCLLIAGVATWYASKPSLFYFFMFLLIYCLNRAPFWRQEKACSVFYARLLSMWWKDSELFSTTVCDLSILLVLKFMYLSGQFPLFSYLVSLTLSVFIFNRSLFHFHFLFLFFLEMELCGHSVREGEWVEFEWGIGGS